MALKTAHFQTIFINIFQCIFYACLGIDEDSSVKLKKNLSLGILLILVYISCKFKKASPLLYSLQFFLAMARQSILDFVGLSVYWYVLTAMHPLWIHRKEILYICCCTILHKSPLSTYYELDKVCKKTTYLNIQINSCLIFLINYSFKKTKIKFNTC